MAQIPWPVARILVATQSQVEWVGIVSRPIRVVLTVVLVLVPVLAEQGVIRVALTRVWLDPQGMTWERLVPPRLVVSEPSAWHQHEVCLDYRC